MVDIFYLDYGQSECVALDRICRSTPGDVLSRRTMAQYITLEGVQPVSSVHNPAAYGGLSNISPY